MVKVAEVYPGKDNNVRVMYLKNSTGEIVRPVQRIYPLAIRSSTTEKEKVDTYLNETGHSNKKNCGYQNW